MRFLTEIEVAARLNCSRQHVNKLIQDKSLSATNISTKGMQRACWRISVEDVEKFICDRQSVKPLARRPRVVRSQAPNIFG